MAQYNHHIRRHTRRGLVSDIVSPNTDTNTDTATNPDGGSGGSQTTTTTTTTSAGDGNGGNGGGPTSKTTTTTTSTSPTSTSTSTTSTSTKTTKADTNTDTSTTSKTTSTSSTTSTTESSSSTTTTSKTTSQTSTTPTPTPTGQQTQNTITNTLYSTSTPPGDSNTPTVDGLNSTGSPSPGGSINTGAVAGGIAGGLVAIALLGIIVACLIRRRRNRLREDEFDAAQFRRSALPMDDPNPTSPISRPGSFFGGAIRPLSNLFTGWRPGHNVAPSLSSAHSAGLAGHGAWRPEGHEEQQVHQDPFYDPSPGGEPEMQQRPSQVQVMVQQPEQPSVVQERRGLQPRQQYTFGQAYEPQLIPSADAHYIVDDRPFVDYDYAAAAAGAVGSPGGEYHPYGQTPYLSAGAPPVTLHHQQHQPDNDDAYGGM